MARLDWKETNGNFSASPAEGVEVTAYKNGSLSEWRIHVHERWVKRGICRDMAAAKSMAEKEVGVYLRG